MRTTGAVCGLFEIVHPTGGHEMRKRAPTNTRGLRNIPEGSRTQCARKAHNMKGLMITIIVTPKPGGYFAASVDGEHITTSTTPLLTTARKLLATGVDPNETLQMKHRGSDTIALRSTVGYAAKRAVRENETQGPLLVRYVTPGVGGRAQSQNSATGGAKCRRTGNGRRCRLHLHKSSSAKQQGSHQLSPQNKLARVRPRVNRVTASTRQ